MPFEVSITEKGGQPTHKRFDKAEITVGRVQDNDICLPKGNVSKRHARIIHSGGDDFVVIDSKSTNGTYINGKRITAPYDLADGDKLFIGDFVIEVFPISAAQTDEGRARNKAPLEDESSVRDDGLDGLDDAWDGLGGEGWSEEWDQSEEYQAVAQDFIDEQHLHDDTYEASQMMEPSVEDSSAGSVSADLPTAEDETRTAMRGDLHPKRKGPSAKKRLTRPTDNDELPTARRSRRPSLRDTKLRQRRMPSPTSGLGILDELLRDPEISEIDVSGTKVFVKRGGERVPADVVFGSEKDVLELIGTIAAFFGRRVDSAAPMLDGRFDDGTYVTVLIPPMAVGGPSITIQKSTPPQTMDELVVGASLSGEMAAFLEESVEEGKSILVSGPSRSGKMTMLNVLASNIPDDERIITVEDVAELQLDQKHVVRLEGRPADPEGHAAISVVDLLRAASRMRPDRIVVGSIQGAEAWEILDAMIKHGVMASIHASSADDAVSRMERLIVLGGFALSSRAIRAHIARAVDIIVHQNRDSSGERKVSQVCEVIGVENDEVVLKPIFNGD